MKIAIFTDTFTPDVNGVAKTLERYTRYLRENDIEYLVFAPQVTKENQYSNQIHYFRSLPFLLYPECRIAFPNFLHIKDHLNEFKPDIIHVTTPFSMGLAGLHYAKKLNIPVVGSYHTDFDKYLEHYNLQSFTVLLWKYLKWFHRPLQKIFVPSEDTRERLITYQFENLSIWPRGIDREHYNENYNIEEVREKYQIKEKHILLYVGRIAPEKDVILLPEIAKNLPKAWSENIHWLVVGDGPMQTELQKAAPANMTFTGFVEGEDLAAMYTAADLFVFPSASETFGNVVLEALSSGTPVIGANAGGVRTIVEHGVTGMLCKEKNAQDFAEAITKVLAEQTLIEAMGQAGIQYAKAQSWDAIFTNLIHEYNDVVSEGTYKQKELA